MAEPTVGIDAGPLLGRGGISGYVAPLVRALLALDGDARYRLVLRRGWRDHPGADALAALAPLHRVHVPDRVLALAWDRLGWTLPGLWRGLDVFLATCLVAPALGRGRVVSIVYDLIPLRLPHLFADHATFRRRLEVVVARSAALVAISERTRQDLVELLGVEPGRVRVIPPGRSPAFGPVAPARVEEVTRRLGLRGPYVLYVGALGPHKNVTTLLRAYQRARLEGGLGARLVVAGSHRWGAETLAALEGLRVRDDVTLTGEVAEEDLPPLYAGARLFVFPSRYEGFGLPVLEAMASGTPVVASNGGALPEVGGDAVVYVSPDDEAALAEAMARVAGDPATRARLAERGRMRAAAFSWERSAGELRALLAEVAGRPEAVVYDADYFEGRTRQSPPHRREVIYPLAERTASFLCRRLAPVRVLDLGCAKGFLVEAFRAHGAGLAAGVDVSEYAVGCQESDTAGRLLVADAGAGLPLRSASWDLVTSVDLFEHLADPRPVLAEIRRVLRDGGAAYLKICHPRHPNARRDPTHVNVQPLGYWREQFRRAGFASERLWETDFVPAAGPAARLRAWVHRWREWAVIGTPADYKFLLRKRAHGG